jgi:hypothetical protein
MCPLQEIARQAGVWQAASGAVSLHLRQHRRDGRLIRHVVRIHPGAPTSAVAAPFAPTGDQALPPPLADLLSRVPTPLLLLADATLAAVALPRHGAIALAVAPDTPRRCAGDLPDGLWTLLPPRASAHLRLAHAADAIDPARLPAALRARLDAARPDRSAGRLLVQDGRGIALLHLPSRPLLLRV